MDGMDWQNMIYLDKDPINIVTGSKIFNYPKVQKLHQLFGCHWDGQLTSIC